MIMDKLPNFFEALHLYNETAIELPQELLEIIFHLAAAECRRFCYSLCSVSAWGRTIALRYLLVSLKIKCPESNFRAVQIIAGNILHQPSHLIPGDLVQNIWMPYIADSFVLIFESCKNLKNLAVNSHSFDHLVDAACGTHPWRTISETALRREQDLHLFIFTTKKNGLSTTLSRVEMMATSHLASVPIFLRITHLQLTQWVSYYAHLYFPPLTRLTHLALSCYDAKYHTILRFHWLLGTTNLQLKMLVIMIFTDILSESERAETESEIKRWRSFEDRVYGYPIISLDPENMWFEGANGGQSVWEGAIQYSEQNL